MRESWWLWKINERVDAQRCLLEQRVWSCVGVSRPYTTWYILNQDSLSSCIVNSGRSLGFVVSKCRCDIASLAPLTFGVGD